MKTDKQIIKEKIIDFLFEKEEILFAYLFGSYVEEEVFNDIDLAIYSREEIDTIKIAFELEKLIKIGFDVIDIVKASDHLIHSISKGELIKDKNEDFRIDFITSAWSRYCDFIYYRDRYLEELNYDK